MPFARCTTSVPCTNEQKESICSTLSAIVAQVLQKPESYMMTAL